MLQDIMIIHSFYARIIHSFVCVTFCLIILFIWAHVSIVQLLGIMLLTTSTYKCLSRHVLPISLERYLRMELLGFMLTAFK